MEQTTGTTSTPKKEKLFSFLEAKGITGFFDRLRGENLPPVLRFLLPFPFFLVLSFVLISLLSTTTTYLYPNVPYMFTDSVFFQQVGKMIVEGKTPYVDIFDHKGIYFFWYEALCYLIHPRYGFFVMDFLIYAIVLFFVYRTLREIPVSSATTWTALLLFIFFTCFIREGNITEDFSLLFLAPSFYFFIHTLTHPEKQKRNFLIANAMAGAFSGILLFTRANNCAILLFAVIGYAILAISKKDFKGLFLNFLACVLPFLAFCAIPLLVAHYGGYLYEMIDQTFLLNAEYTTSHFDVQQIILMILDILSTILFSILLVRFRKKGIYAKDLLLLLLVDMIGTGLVFAYTSHYPHYYVVTYPLLVTVMALGIERLFTLGKENRTMEKGTKAIYILRAVLPIALFGNFLYFVSGYYSFIPDGYGKVEVMEEMIDYIEESDKDDGKKGEILAIDVNPSFYLLTDRLPEERHFAYQTWQTMTYPSVYVELTDYIEEERPEWIVIDDTDPFYFNGIDDEHMLQREELLSSLEEMGYVFHSFSEGEWGEDRIVEEEDGTKTNVLSKERGLGVYEYVG